MIIYSKTLWGLPLLSRIYGSALPRALAPAVIAGFITLGLTFVHDEVQALWFHPYAYNAFVLLTSFVLTFRSNYAYQRHWEAYSNMQIMASKWVDAAMQIVMFDRHPQMREGSSSKPGAPTDSELTQHKTFVAELVHMISLLHAVSCQALRRDPDLHNLTRHSKDAQAPPSDPALLRSPGSGSAAAGSNGSSAAAGAAAAPAASPPPPPAAAAAAAAEDEETDGRQQKGIMSAWGRGTNIVGSANWRDIFMLRGSSEAIRKYNAAQPLPVIGGTSLDELAALGCSRHFFSSDWQEMSPQQQQKLPRSRSLSQLFTAGHSSTLATLSGGRDRGAGARHTSGAFGASVTGHGYGFRRSNSNLSDYGLDDSRELPDTSAAAAAAAAAAIDSHMEQQVQQGLVTETSWGGPMPGRFLASTPPPTPPSIAEGGDEGRAHDSSRSSSHGCWPRSKHKQQQQGADLGHHHQADQQQQQQQRGAVRRFCSADGGLNGRQQQQQQQQGHVSIPAASFASKNFSFAGGYGSNGGSNGGGWDGSSGCKPGGLLKRVPSTRYLLISRNCSCCKGHLPFMDRPLLVMAWLHELLLQRQTEGGLRMPAPILSRVYACLSDGLQGFEQNRKLADTPFPFPWAQFVLVMLVLFTCTLPLLILAYVPNHALAVVLTVVTVATYWTVNEVARDVEDPFLYEPNDMPLANSQYHMNELLLSLAHTHRPASTISSLRRAANYSSRPLSPAAAAYTSSGSNGKHYQHHHQQQQQQQYSHNYGFDKQQQHQQQQQQQQQSYRVVQGYAASPAAAEPWVTQAQHHSLSGPHSQPLPSPQCQLPGPHRHAPSGPADQHLQPPEPTRMPAAAAAGGMGTPIVMASFGSITESQLPPAPPAAMSAAAAAPAAPAAEVELSAAGLGSPRDSIQLWQQQQQQQQPPPLTGHSLPNSTATGAMNDPVHSTTHQTPPAAAAAVAGGSGVGDEPSSKPRAVTIEPWGSIGADQSAAQRL